jgi:prolyl oligopeptidase
MPLSAIPRRLQIGLALACGLLSSALAAAPGQPVAPVRPVTDDYFGTPVVDNYRYIKDLGDADIKT